MTKLSALALAITCATSAVAADGNFDIQRNGNRSIGTSTVTGAGEHLVGRNVSTGEPFDLVVRNGWVTGQYGVEHVRFRSDNSTVITTSFQR